MRLTDGVGVQLREARRGAAPAHHVGEDVGVVAVALEAEHERVGANGAEAARALVHVGQVIRPGADAEGVEDEVAAVPRHGLRRLGVPDAEVEVDGGHVFSVCGRVEVEDGLCARDGGAEEPRGGCCERCWWS
jgi:hypothetical protein